MSDISIVRQSWTIVMQTGKRGEIFYFTLLIVLIGLACSSGCIQPTNPGPGSGPGPSYSPQPTPVVTGQGSAGPENEIVPSQSGQVAGTPAGADNQAAVNSTPGPKYAAGSSVQKNPADSSYDKDRAWVIIKVNGDDTYTVGQIYLDPQARVWFKVSEELPVVRAIHAVERDYPVLKGTVDWNTFPTKHGVVDQYGTTRLEW